MQSGTSRQEYPYVSHFNDRHGKLRWRYRKDGKSYALGTDYGGPEFMRRLASAQQGQRPDTTPGVITQGRLAHAITQWVRKPEHRASSPATRRARSVHVDVLRDAFGSLEINSVRAADITAFMTANAHRPSLANRCLGVLRAVLEDAVAAEKIMGNPALSVERFPVDADPYYVWTEEDIQAFNGVHAGNELACLTLVLMLYTGARSNEVVQLGPHSIHAGRLRFVKHHPARPDGVLVDIPLHPALAECISSSTNPQRATFLQTQAGSQRSAAGLRNLMREWCSAADLSECSSDGLRKACARRLKEAGVREQEVAAVLGYANTVQPHAIVGMGHRPDLADTAFASLVTLMGEAVTVGPQGGALAAA